jgi:hypothetical protein
MAGAYRGIVHGTPLPDLKDEILQTCEVEQKRKKKKCSTK